MEDAVKLNAQKREESGTKVARRLRESGYLPAVMYGHQKGTVAMAVDMHDFVEGLHHGHRLFEVELDGQKETTMVKDLQYDYLGRDVVHADLIRVDITEQVTVAVAIRTRGEAVGLETEGAIVEEHTDSVEVECQVNQIPDEITVRVDDLEAGDSIYARDVELPANVKLASDPDLVLVSCSVVEEMPSPEELEAEEPVAPEVIGAEKEEEAEAEEGAGGEEQAEEQE
jgi:large subunit ribosomal protein L25